MILFGAIAASAALSLALIALTSARLPAVRRPAIPLAARWREWRGRGRVASAAVAVLRATEAGLRSGMTLQSALRAALGPCDASQRGPFEPALRALELNAAPDEALAAAGQRTADRRVRSALDALALVASEDLPSSRGAALIGAVADRLAFEERLREEVDARASGARTQIVILALVVPALALYLTVTLPGLASTLATPLGAHVLVPVAILLEIAGVVMSRAIVAGLEL